MEFSIWPVLMQATAFLVLLIALGVLGFALLSSIRRHFYQQDVYAIALENFEEALMTARVRRVDRGRESASWSGLRKFRQTPCAETAAGVSRSGVALPGAAAAGSRTRSGASVTRPHSWRMASTGESSAARRAG